MRKTRLRAYIVICSIIGNTIFPYHVFAANQTPSIGTITPSSGSSKPNQSVKFRTSYIDSDGWGNIKEAGFQITSIASRAKSYLVYNQNTNKLYLKNLKDNTLIGGFLPGASKVIQDSYIKLECNNTNVSGSGNTLRISWGITFKSTFIGKKNLYLFVADDSGASVNWTKAGTWVIDGIPPKGTIFINSNFLYTNSDQITLKLQATDSLTEVTQMKFSNDNINWSAAEVYNTTKTWILSTSDGVKTVYVKFKDKAGNWSVGFSDQIILDTTTPEIKIITPKYDSSLTKDSIKIWGTTSEEADVFINGIKPYTGNMIYAIDEFPVVVGQDTIEVKAIDLAGNTGILKIPIDIKDLPGKELLLDGFNDTQPAKNKLGWWTGDNKSCLENIDIDGYHKLTWNNNSAYWYSSLWDKDNLPQGTDVSYYEIFTFKIKGQVGGESLSVEIEDIPHGPEFNKKVQITATNQWQEVNIPLAVYSYNGIWKTQLMGVVFNFDKSAAGTIYIDDLKFKSAVIDNFADTQPITNSLGYITTSSGSLAEDTESGGVRKFKWGNLSSYWYTDLWGAESYYDAGNFKYLYLRIQGENGGEDFSIQLEDDVIKKVLNLSQYGTITKDWEYIYIPVKDFNLNLKKLKTLTTKFDKNPSGAIYLDKIGFGNGNFSSIKKSVSTGPVKIIGKQLLINNIPFLIKGICYQPTPIGTEPKANPDLFQKPDIWNRDLIKIREIGCNTIRVWKNMNSIEFLDACYNNGNESIYVVMGFDIDPKLDLSNTIIRDQIKSGFQQYVTQYKDHPAILIWALGNEMNHIYKGDPLDWYTLANELSHAAYQIEGVSYHPVCIVNMDTKNLGDPTIKSDDDSLNYIDIWGINAYRGHSYRGFFNTCNQLTAKPILITEYGADSWHTNNQLLPQEGYEDQKTQKDYYVNNYKEFLQAVGVIGGTLMEYCDEWHKVLGGNYDKHDYGGYGYRYDQPDNYVNEEWWGLFSIEDDGTDVDKLIPRQAVIAVKNMFMNQDEVLDTEPPEDITNLKSAPSDQKVLLTWNKSINTSGDLADQILYIKTNSGYGPGISLGKETIAYEANSLTNGTLYTFKITCKDINQNESAGKTVQAIPIDNIPPEDITGLTAISGDKKVTLIWNASKNTSGDLTDQLLYIDNVSPKSLGPIITQYTIDNLTNNKQYNFKITCIDEVPNESKGAVISATPQSPLAPKIKITSPQNGFITKGNTINITGTIDKNDAKVTVNGITAIVAAGTFSANNIPLQKEEENQIIAAAVLNNYTGQDMIIIYKDTIPPEVEVTYPKDGEVVIGYE